VKPLFLTRALLQNTRAKARFEIFGNPDANVKCVYLLKETLSELGHQVQLLTSTPGDVLFKLQEIILEEEKAKNRKARTIHIDTAHHMLHQTSVEDLRAWPESPVQWRTHHGRKGK